MTAAASAAAAAASAAALASSAATSAASTSAASALHTRRGSKSAALRTGATNAPLMAYAPPSATRVVVAWLLPLCGAGGVGARRPSAAQLPYRMVTVVAGHETPEKVRECPVVSVHTFANNYDDAEAAAQVTHQRMLLMGPPLVGPQQVTITNSDGSAKTVEPDYITCTQLPIWADYEDDLIFRFVARYEIGLRFMANDWTP